MQSARVRDLYPIPQLDNTVAGAQHAFPCRTQHPEEFARLDCPAELAAAIAWMRRHNP